MSLTLLLLSLILFQQSICQGNTPQPPADTNGDTHITNNCGMALFYQPTKKGLCTDISLVDGYCCYVVTSTHGNACIRQGEIDEDNKNKITNEMRDAVKRLRTHDVNVDVVITSVECKGYYMAFYGLSLLLLAVML